MVSISTKTRDLVLAPMLPPSLDSFKQQLGDTLTLERDICKAVVQHLLKHPGSNASDLIPTNGKDDVQRALQSLVGDVGYDPGYCIVALDTHTQDTGSTTNALAIADVQSTYTDVSTQHISPTLLSILEAMPTMQVKSSDLDNLVTTNPAAALKGQTNVRRGVAAEGYNYSCILSNCESRTAPSHLSNLKRHLREHHGFARDDVRSVFSDPTNKRLADKFGPFPSKEITTGNKGTANSVKNIANTNVIEEGDERGQKEEISDKQPGIGKPVELDSLPKPGEKQAEASSPVDLSNDDTPEVNPIKRKMRRSKEENRDRRERGLDKGRWGSDLTRDSTGKFASRPVPGYQQRLQQEVNNATDIVPRSTIGGQLTMTVDEDETEDDKEETEDEGVEEEAVATKH